MLFSGVFDPARWQHVIIALALTHVTIVCVTVFLYVKESHKPGTIERFGHYWGYRNFPTADASTNMAHWGLLIGGEELHNNHHAFHKVYWMHSLLVALWQRSAASKEQLVRQLQGWCESAEASGIPPLAAFSRRLRCYV